MNLDGLPSTESLLSGIQARDHGLQTASLSTTHNKPRPQGTRIWWLLGRFFLIFNQIFLASVLLNFRSLHPTNLLHLQILRPFKQTLKPNYGIIRLNRTDSRKFNTILKAMQLIVSCIKTKPKNEIYYIILKKTLKSPKYN